MDRLLRVTQANPGRDSHTPAAVALPENALIDVETAEYVSDYRLLIRFSDQHQRIVDFEPFLKSTLNPLIRRYLDKDLFTAFTVAYGDLVWGDYELCFPVADLYEGRL